MARTQIFRGVIVAALVVVALCVAACSSESPPDTHPGSDLGEMLRERVGDSDGGVSAQVVRDGVEQRAVAGNANAAGQAIGRDTAFRVGSISKPFVATMVLQLVDEEKVDLDLPLSTYLPTTSVGGDATVRALLSHQSGIANYTDQSSFFQDAFAEPLRTYSPDDVLAYVEGVESPAAPGTFAYSNTNYILLGQLVEKIDRVSLDSALRRRITAPLALESTTFGTDPLKVPKTLAAGWSDDLLNGDPVAPYRSISSGAWAAGALISTPRDLRAFLVGLFGGTLLPGELLSEMTDGGGDTYGLGLERITVGSGRTVFGHSGGIPGYTSNMVIDPESLDSVIVLTNNDGLFAGQFTQNIVEIW